ncbi:hypothetical protein STEG23_033912, partial [Scotinomys teguina]
SVKNCVRILMGIALNLYIAFGNTAIKQSRYRIIIQEAANGGQECPDTLFEERECEDISLCPTYSLNLLQKDIPLMKGGNYRNGALASWFQSLSGRGEQAAARHVGRGCRQEKIDMTGKDLPQAHHCEIRRHKRIIWSPVFQRSCERQNLNVCEN